MERKFLSTVNDAAILNLYLYLGSDFLPSENASFFDIILRLYYNRKRNIPKSWSSRKSSRLNIILNYLNKNKFLASAKLIRQTCTDEGLCACAFSLPDGKISVAFKGTGTGEWIDNGEGLSGILQKNTYITNGKAEDSSDFATDQQVEALNWFNKLIYEKHLNPADIILSGHSKGGNKAQFISLFYDVFSCISFDGQGFSPEALSHFNKTLGTSYSRRRETIFSFSSENDYINVLGSRLAPKENIYYLKSSGGFHFLESILNKAGELNAFCCQGKLSEYVENVSDELMRLAPSIRKYATLGVMNLFQKYIVDEPSVNGDSVSVEKTIAGLAVATFSVLKSIVKNRDSELKTEENCGIIANGD